MVKTHHITNLEKKNYCYHLVMRQRCSLASAAGDIKVPLHGCVSAIQHKNIYITGATYTTYKILRL